MDKKRQEQIIKAMNARMVNQPCPRCLNPQFEVVGEAIIPLNDNPSQVTIGGPAVPVILAACSRCGFITQHAQGPLGLFKGGDA